ncbi:MAG: ABC transporter permease [Gammaproteobacteria bacterium]|nr:ABC transporter permease [Gammaproteobacteria bacterium]
MITTIAKHECSSLFRSTSIWVLTGLLALAMALLFLQQVERYIAAQPALALQDHPPGLTAFLGAGFLAPVAVLFLMLGPLLAMRSFSDEFRKDTYALWQSSPVPNSSIVIGKFLGVVSALALWILLSVAMVASMQLFVMLDWGLLLANTSGLLLSSMACAAVGIFFSSLTRQPLVAAIASFACLMILWLLGKIPLSGIASGVQGYSIASHLNSFFNGYLSLADVLYFCVIIALFLALTIIRLDSLRHTGH